MLPEPERMRWEPLRIGFVELYRFDVEEFRFRNGHLLLRGNNGTGKSKVLSLTLPFLFDAHLSAPRVEPDGDRNKRMEWNLLMGGRYDRRVGYTWAEFGRRDETGRVHTVTLGCGLRAVAGRSGIDSWFFVTEQRIGDDLWLTTPEHTAVSRERLIEMIGARGQVYRTAEDYRRAVDERMFNLGTERYGALVDTLIQLRQPQLSKQPNEERLSAALTEALTPLDRVSLENVAEAMSHLEDMRRELDDIEIMRKAVESFQNRYRRYAQVAARRKARVLRQAQTEHDNTSRELNAAEKSLKNARESESHWADEVERLSQQVRSDRARLGVLRDDPVMRDLRRLDHARERAGRSHRALEEAEKQLKSAEDQLAREVLVTASRHQDAEGTRSALVFCQESASSHASLSSLAEEHERLLGGVDWPDGVGKMSAESLDDLMSRVRDLTNRRREQLDLIRGRLRELDKAELERVKAQSARNSCADALDSVTASLSLSVGRFEQEARSLLEAWRKHLNHVVVLDIGSAEESLLSLESWLESLDGPCPMHRVLDFAGKATERSLSSQESELRMQRRNIVEEREALNSERIALTHGEDSPPPVPYTRGVEARKGRPGASLWSLVDFASGVNDRQRAGVEAALEAAGLLDAWLMPDGRLLDPDTHDTILTTRRACGPSLAEWLVPAIPDDSTVQADTITTILGSIACDERESVDAEAWVSPSGVFRIGTLRGAWAKQNAEYIGHAARQAARRRRLLEIVARLSELGAALSSCEEGLAKCENTRQMARMEQENAPSEATLVQADSDRSADDRQRRDAQARLGTAESALSNAERGVELARRQLIDDARDLNLPPDVDGVSALERQLQAYLTAMLALANAARDHRRALGEVGVQKSRESQVREVRDASASYRAEKQSELRVAEATLDTLRETVGKPVEELLVRIEEAERALESDEQDSEAAQGHRADANRLYGSAEKDFEAKRVVLTERARTRADSITAFQAFARDTELLAIAVASAPKLTIPDVQDSWGVDMALGLARRTEQALVEVSAEDSDWERVQREIGRDLTDLQSAMSAHGHSANAEFSDYGLVVRIVHQQRPVRPDILEHQLDAELAERKALLTEQERAVLEEHLEKEIAANLQRMIQEAESRVAAINKELDLRPTSTGVRYRLVWEPVPEDTSGGLLGLSEARKRLLRTSADAWSSEDRRQLGEFLQTRIAAEAGADNEATMYESLRRALDYRRWHRFRVQRFQDGQWRPLTGPASSGERALGLTVPLFAACSSHYESAGAHAPRLVLLDEAFAGIDDEARANCMALIREFDLDFVMTSEREWGCYPELPGLSICQLVRREGVDAVFVSRWNWDGRVRTPRDEQVRRFPEATVASGSDGDRLPAVVSNQASRS